MGKPTTKKVKAPSRHSRAARRETSPSINTDKSLKDVQAPTESLNQRPAVLGLYQNAGVNKKTKKRGRKAVLSTRAGKRHERAMERAEEIIDRTASKVAKSKQSGARVEGRRKGWEEINAAAEANKAAVNKFAGLANEGDEKEEDLEEVDEFDDEMGDAEPVKGSAKGAGASAPATAALAAPTPLDDDEIL